MLDFSKYHIIDLTLAYEKGIAGYNREVAKTLTDDGWNASTLHLYSHAGTHMDAPLHFGVNSLTIDSFLPHQLIGKAWVVHVPIKQSHQSIKVNDLGSIAEQFKPGDSMLLRTNWNEYRFTPKYRNELPRISEDLAYWCVEHQVNMLGVEPPSVADVNNLQEVTKIHQILLGGKVIIIEGLCNLDQLSKVEVLLIALPLKIKNGDGAPARVIALEEKV
ncbi:MAG: cyclase family protein [Bacteroidota bacterium]